MKKVEDLSNYIQKTLGARIHLELVPNQDLGKLPFYMKGSFRFYKLKLMGCELVLAELKKNQPLTTTQIRKQFQKIKEVFGTNPVLATKTLSSIHRSRLIENRINFIVPGKHLFLPDLMIDLREKFDTQKIQKETLLPSAQVLLLYWILRRNEEMEEYALNQLAHELNYTPMAISNAVAELARWNLCEVSGRKEKHLRFHQTRAELWHRSLALMTSPVLKSINADILPDTISLCKSNISALAQYTDINEGDRHHYALGKKAFAGIKKDLTILDSNDTDANFSLEVWKYDPGILTGTTKARSSVDPLSLYLSMKDNQDERIEKSLEKIMGEILWS